MFASTILKNTRLDRELELQEISKKLKIPIKYLIALEEEDIKTFPQEPYCSLIVKDYAEFLGLNGQEILKLFRRDYEQKKKIKSHRKHSFSFTPQFTFTLSVILTVLLFSAYLISEYVKFNRPPKLKVNWPINEIVLSTAYDLSGITDPESTVRINQDLIIVDSKGNFKKKIIISDNEIKVTVESKSPSGKSTVDEKILKTNQ